MSEYVLNGDLWCRDTKDGIWVVNGQWSGHIDGDEFVCTRFPEYRVPFIKTWDGKHNFRDKEYNEMLAWAKEQHRNDDAC